MEEIKIKKRRYNEAISCINEAIERIENRHTEEHDLEHILFLLKLAKAFLREDD